MVCLIGNEYEQLEEDLVRLGRISVAGVVVVLVLSGVAACGRSGSGSSAGKLRVVAAENVWSDIAAQIGGDQTSVTSLISSPDDDPHTFESGPQAAFGIGSADVVIVNGVGYDDWATKLVDANGRSGRTVIDVGMVTGVRTGANPHLWYDPTYVTAAAHRIAAAFAEKLPSGTAGFDERRDAFLRAYQPYVDTIATIDSKYRGTRVGFTERVPGYLLSRAGLVDGTPEGFARAVEEGNDPAPGNAASFTKALRDKTIRVLLYNDQVTDAVADKVRSAAVGAGVPVVGVGETIPRGVSFQSWQQDQATALLRALGG